MNQDMIIRNARLVLGDEVVQGSLAIAGGTIAAIDTGGSAALASTDLDGDLLIPGLVELHTDNLERHLSPRPKVRWPVFPALLAHDTEMAGAGITTVFDALGIGSTDAEAVRGQTWRDLLQHFDHAQATGLLRCDHFLHARCELPAPNAIDLFQPFAQRKRLQLISLMDHTPGQRQWENIDQARVYYTGKHGWSDEKFDRQLAASSELQQRHAAANRAYFVDYANGRDIAIATHDDTTEAHVEEAVSAGATIAEFPTTVTAARAARRNHLSVIMGAPNLVRGGSHSGNVAAAELAKLGLLDALSSDYVPASLLLSAFMLTRDAGFAIPDALATVTRNPARAAGLGDRGEIEIGRRADLVQVRLVAQPGADSIPVVVAVWRAGQRIV